MSLLSDIDAFVARTGTPERAVGWHSVKDGGLVKRLRAGATPQPATEQRVRSVMRDNPNGLPFRQRGERGPFVGEPEQTGARVDRDPCPWCNTRGDIGCAHGRAGVNW